MSAPFSQLTRSRGVPRAAVNTAAGGDPTVLTGNQATDRQPGDITFHANMELLVHTEGKSGRDIQELHAFMRSYSLENFRVTFDVFGKMDISPLLRTSPVNMYEGHVRPSIREWPANQLT